MNPNIESLKSNPNPCENYKIFLEACDKFKKLETKVNNYIVNTSDLSKNNELLVDEIYNFKKLNNARNIYFSEYEHIEIKPLDLSINHYAKIIKFVYYNDHDHSFPFTINSPIKNLRRNYWRDLYVDIRSIMPDSAKFSPYIIQLTWEQFAKNFEYNEMQELGEIIKQKESVRKKERSKLELKFNEILKELIKKKKVVLSTDKENQSPIETSVSSTLKKSMGDNKVNENPPKKLKTCSSNNESENYLLDFFVNQQNKSNDFQDPFSNPDNWTQDPSTISEPLEFNYPKDENLNDFFSHDCLSD
jgi:hypothetical protein